MHITFHDLKTLTEEPYFSRGRSYYQEGNVKLISVLSNQVKARVIGTRLYQVVLSRKGSHLVGTCNCPAVEDFGPCKHIAATGFALLAHLAGEAIPGQGYDKKAGPFEAVEKFLSSRTKQELVTLIFQLASDFPEVMWALEEL